MSGVPKSIISRLWNPFRTTGDARRRPHQQRDVTLHIALLWFMCKNTSLSSLSVHNNPSKQKKEYHLSAKGAFPGYRTRNIDTNSYGSVWFACT
ncbi:hypothetical protein AVEN_48216-1 [Araneus ventricosus]|uniref:Uncharacterized protein n=1 Tax=Araneus ventricosus TaxID=182803 RepID=A0A4Y2B2R5_ARAVE|nr:hypothetical protein AVEN_48216-1 [Araneus ventricosus]